VAAGPARGAPVRVALRGTIWQGRAVGRVSVPAQAPVGGRRRRAAGLVDLVVPASTERCMTTPGVDRLLELRWAVLVRRAPVMTPEQHATAVADPQRRAAEIEIPIPCLLCGETRLQALLHVHEYPREPPRWDYHVVRCAACGLLFRHPGIRPERLGDLYSSGKYAQFLSGRYTRRRLRRYRATMAPFGRLFRRGRGRRLLDFGCGTGLFLELAHRRGFDCYGVDLAPDAIAMARQKPSGRHAHHGRPADIPELAAGGFDVVTMWSVLAHLAQPVDDLTMLRRLLGPDGVLLLLTVNAASIKLKQQLETWGGFTPNHLAFFAPDTLRRLLRTAGFGAVVMPPWYGGPVERGTSRLSPRDERRLRRVIDRGNRGNMLRAAAFVDPDGPERWRLRGTPL
jgi:SAM-dependent methyltransferase